MESVGIGEGGGGTEVDAAVHCAGERGDDGVKGSVASRQPCTLRSKLPLEPHLIPLIRNPSAATCTASPPPSPAPPHTRNTPAYRTHPLTP